MKDDWCAHIILVADRYEIYSKYVPADWIYCPVCGEKRPE